MTTLAANSRLRLQGKTALITGASRGIGFAIAEAYAREGADLILSASTEAALVNIKNTLADHGVDVACVAADLSQEKEVDDLFAFATERQPEWDILVNNAGILLSKPFTECSMDEFDQVMKVNVYAIFQLMQHAIGHMQKLGRGKVVNISSTAGKWGGMNMAAYSASKHAIVGLTRCVALENAKNNININAICPGFVDTDLMKGEAAKLESSGVSSEEFRGMIEELVPMGRMLQPEEVANIAVYLASHESDGMTGQTITISGGMRMG